MTDDRTTVSDYLVLGTWEAITLLGQAGELCDTDEISDMIAKTEAILISVVSELPRALADPAARSTADRLHQLLLAVGELVVRDGGQAGFWLGGPIKKDRLFFFFNFENTNQNGVYVVQPDLPSLSALGASAPAPYDGKTLSAKFDYQVNLKNELLLSDILRRLDELKKSSRD